jgi:hypothetical protein
MRTVIENPNVSETIDREVSNYPRLEEAYDALKWWLSHVPQAGEIIDDLHWLYKQDADTHLNLPSILVIYTFDASTVVFEFILVRFPVIQ